MDDREWIGPDLDLDDVRSIQHDLAEVYRARTGRIPQGQLWQECPRCRNDDEVACCLNCLCCARHCSCPREES